MAEPGLDPLVAPPKLNDPLTSGFQNFLIDALRNTGEGVGKLAHDTWYGQPPSLGEAIPPLTETALGLVGPKLGMAAAPAAKSLLQTGLETYGKGLEKAGVSLSHAQVPIGSTITGSPWNWQNFPGAPKDWKHYIESSYGAFNDFEKSLPVDAKERYQQWKDYNLDIDLAAQKKKAGEPRPGYKYGSADIGFSPTANIPGSFGEDKFVVANGKKIGEITAPDDQGEPWSLYMNHWGDNADAKYFTDYTGAKNAAIRHAKQIPVEGIKNEKGLSPEADILAEAQKSYSPYTSAQLDKIWNGKAKEIFGKDFYDLSGPNQENVLHRLDNTIHESWTKYLKPEDYPKAGSSVPMHLRPEWHTIPKGKVPFDPSALALEQGYPVASAHGGTRSFDAFSLPEYITGHNELGAHFGSPKAAAERVGAYETQQMGHTYPVVLSAKNPLRMSDLGSWGPSNIESELRKLGFPHQELRDVRPAGGSGANWIQALRDYITSKGHDSIIYRNSVEDPGHDSYIMFQRAADDPSKIKGIRVPWAEFDPSKIDFANLTAGLGGAGFLGAAGAEQSRGK